MTVLKLAMAGNNLDELVNYMISKLTFDYENHSPDTSIVISEEYYFRNGSTQLNLIIFKKADSSIFIDIIGGAGGTGLLNINWGSEKSFTKKAQKILGDYAAEYKLDVENR